MTKYSAKQRRLRGRGKSNGPGFIQLFHYVKRSAAYHSLSVYGRAFLTELIDRYNGSNNGSIRLGVREAAFEMNCSHSTACKAMRDVDDAGLARPTLPGAWRGKRATEWRLMWRRCDKNGDLPKTQWPERRAYQPTAPGPKSAEIEFGRESTKGREEKHRDSSSPEGKPQNGDSSIKQSNSRSGGKPLCTHVPGGMGQEGGAVRQGVAERDPGIDADDGWPELPEFLRRVS